MNPPAPRFFPDADALALHTARAFATLARRAVNLRGEFIVLLPGGSSPLPFYALLGSPSFSGRIPWERVHLFPGDERCVAKEDPLRNGAAIAAALGLPGAARLHPVPEGGDPGEVARRWEAQLRAFFAKRAQRRGFPRFDLAILGMGDDGHTAGLFPGMDAPGADAWTAPVAPGRGGVAAGRVTTTLPLLAAARTRFFYAPGPEKAKTTARILDGAPGTEGMPAARLSTLGRVHWLLTGPLR